MQRFRPLLWVAGRSTTRLIRWHAWLVAVLNRTACLGTLSLAAASSALAGVHASYLRLVDESTELRRELDEVQPCNHSNSIQRSHTT